MNASESMKSVAKASNLVHGDYVVVEYSHSGNYLDKTSVQKRIAYVEASGALTVGGCIPSSGMVGDVLSKPFHISGGDFNQVAVLADGTELRAVSPNGTVVWIFADGSESKGLLAEAIARTPK